MTDPRRRLLTYTVVAVSVLGVLAFVLKPEILRFDSGHAIAPQVATEPPATISPSPETASAEPRHSILPNVSLLAAVAIAGLALVDDDRLNGRDVQETLAGVRVELSECLEDNSVSTVFLAPGTRIAEARGVDM